MNQNDLFEFRFFITVKGDTHDDCLFAFKQIKHYLEAWAFCVKKGYEYKDARKGEIHSRGYQCYMLARANEILLFKESLKCIGMHYAKVLNWRVTVTLSENSCLPKVN